MRGSKKYFVFVTILCHTHTMKKTFAFVVCLMLTCLLVSSKLHFNVGIFTTIVKSNLADQLHRL